MEPNIKEAIHILNEGGLVVYPTDTAFGVGCRIDKIDAIEKLFRIRRRPKSQATPVLVSSISQAKIYYSPPLPSIVRHLMKSFWPGALTIIYSCVKESVPPLVRGGGKNIGIRMPDHPVALSLIEGTGVPLLGPSANFHGAITPYTFEDLDTMFLANVDYVIDGSCKYKEASTVVDCTVVPFQILRQGLVSLNDVE